MGAGSVETRVAPPPGYGTCRKNGGVNAMSMRSTLPRPTSRRRREDVAQPEVVGGGMGGTGGVKEISAQMKQVCTYLVL